MSVDLTKPVFTVKDMAELLDTTPKGIYCRLDRKQLEAFRPFPNSNSLRFKRDYVLSLLGLKQ